MPPDASEPDISPLIDPPMTLGVVIGILLMSMTISTLALGIAAWELFVAPVFYRWP